MLQTERNKMIERLSEQVEDWSLNELVEYAFDQLEKHFMSLSDEELSSVYDETFN